MINFKVNQHLALQIEDQNPHLKPQHNTTQSNTPFLLASTLHSPQLLHHHLPFFLFLFTFSVQTAMGSSIPIVDFVPVGFRFRPTDEELVGHYLKHKLLGNDSMVHSVIAEIDVCKHEPWDLPEFSEIPSDDPEWFFFCPRDYKYAKSKRFNRATERGFWKATGNDRKIKTRGTDDVIGTKKTLVFHKGRVPGVKTNWVIHEYHAVKFEESQRTFVLCRLMKKAEKKAERGTDPLTCDEGEPSRHIGSDYENQATIEGIPDVRDILPETDMESIFEAIDQANIYLPSSTQQSPISIEQEVSFLNSPSANAYFGNENRIMQTPFETTEEENEFFNSMLISEDFVINEKRGHAFVNGPAQSKSLRMVYNDDSDTDIEVASALCGNISDTSIVHHEHPCSSEYQASKLFKSSHGAVHGSTSRLSSNNDANRNKKESTFPDDFWGVETSSCDSTADKPLEINTIEISGSPFQYHPRPSNFISQKSAARRSQTQRKVSSNAVYNVEAEKELLLVRSEKKQKKAQNTSSRGNLETKSHHSSDVNRKGSFICMDTPSSSQSLFPRSVYFVNVVIGILLLIVISWDVLSC